eukprot:645116-Pelagomonas_calceolata.AAC.4
MLGHTLTSQAVEYAHLIGLVIAHNLGAVHCPIDASYCRGVPDTTCDALVPSLQTSCVSMSNALAPCLQTKCASISNASFAKLQANRTTCLLTAAAAATILALKT